MRLRHANGACAMLVALSACGGGGGSTTPSTPAPTPTPCTQSVIDSGTGSIPASTLDYETFSVSATGRLDITVDWTIASSPIGVYVVPVNSCSLAQFNARTCNFLVRSEPSSAKPRKVSTPNFSAGTYNLLLGNFADVEESLSYQVVLSLGSCAALSAGPGSALANQPMTLKNVGRMR